MDEGLFKFIAILLGLFVAWAVFGSKENIGGPFIKPPPPLSSGEVYGGSVIREGQGASSSDTDDTQTDLNELGGELEKVKSLSESAYKGKIEISSHSGARQTSPDKERIELRVSRNVEERIPISNWRIESGVSGVGDTLGEGAYLPYSGQVNTESHIFVEAGDKIVIVTGRSPIGSSFRLNLCTGYFEQFQDFEPSIRKSCPKPIDDMPNMGVGNEAEKCIDFVEKLPRCEIYLKELPLGLGGSCLDYVTTKINYNTCVVNHKNEPDFYDDEWRVYLGRNEELWKKKREIIKLIDHEGKVVDAVTY